MNRNIFIMMLVVVLTAGYPSAKIMAQDAKSPVSYVQDLGLAKVILNPTRKPLKITRDPFKPIIVPVPSQEASSNNPAVAVPSQDNLDDVQVMGIVRLGQEYSAYLKIGDKTRIVNSQENIRNYTITNIDMDQVVFKSGKKVITKKRGKI